MVRLVAARRPREGISLTQILEQYVPDEDSEEGWFVARRWSDGVRCALHIAIRHGSPNERIDVRSRTGAMTADVTLP